MKTNIFKGRKGRPMRLFAVLAAFVASAVVVAVGLNQPPGDLNNPINIVVFPQRDFISASGYLPDDRVSVAVIHDQGIYPGSLGASTYDGTSNTLIAPLDATDPATAEAGIVEVNHPGGACWLSRTPDIRPGDIVRITVEANASDPTRIGRIDETVVQNIVAKRPVQTGPGTVQIHGSAQTNFTGIGVTSPLPLAILEQRLVAAGELFEINGRRTLRADAAGVADGTLAYDQDNNPNGINWTATYTGLTPADVARALAAESRGMWLGNAVLPAGEITTFETGAGVVGGPQAPCNAPKEVLPPPPGVDSLAPSVPTGLTANTLGSPNSVTLEWADSTDTENGANDNPGVTSYGIYRASGNSTVFQPIANVQKPDGTAPAPITYVDKNVPPGNYRYKVDAEDSVGNRSAQSAQSDPVVTTTARPDPNPADIHEPPANGHALLAFPSRDFVSAEGYTDASQVTVEVIRNGNIVSDVSGLIPDETGMVEVNHPGGGCWDGITPELRAGDVVRTTSYNNLAEVISVDQIHVANVTATKAQLVTAPGILPATIKITGTAQDANGLPIPAEQLEQRLIGTSRDPFDLNGRRALLADSAGAGDGALSYDLVNNPTGIKWTATYTLETQHDVDLALEVESRILWLGRDPLAGNELTLFENGLADPPGPAIGFCSAALEAPDELPPSMPLNFAATKNAANDQITFTWSGSSDEWGVAGYRLYDNGNEIAIAGPNTTSLILNNVAPGNHRYTLSAFDNASPLAGVGDFATRIAAGFGNRYGNVSDVAVLATLDGNIVDDGIVTLTDVTPPTAPTNLIGIARDGGTVGALVDLTWNAATDNVGVDHYVVHRGPSGTGPGLDIAIGNVTEYTDTLDASGTREYSISACDAASNCTTSATITVTIPDFFDEVAPVWPLDGSVTAVNTDIHTWVVNVSWTAVVDNVGPAEIARYDLYRASNAAPTGIAAEKIATIAGATTTYADTVPTAGTYRYALIAFDTAGNVSVLSPISNAVVVAHDVPLAGHSLIGFPARDFISASGYNLDPAHSYHFELKRGVRTFASGSIENAFGDATGTVEVNHAGGTCWNVNTPDMRPGDVIRIIDETTGVAEQTVVSNVTAERPIAINANTVIIHGTARQANDQPIPIGQFEHRLVTSTANAFELNDNRTLRAGAGADGTLVYDVNNNPDGTKWTATYTGLSPADMARAVAAESRAVWLGRAPLAGTELTIFENGSGVTGGPSTPDCVAPAETAVAEVSFTPASIDFGSQSYNPASTSAERTITFSNGGDAPLTMANIYFAGLNPGEFLRSVANPGTCPTVLPGELAAGASCTVNVQFSPTVAGLRQAYLNFTNNAANTTDQSVQLTGTGVDASDPRISVVIGPTTTFGTVNGGNFSARTATITNIGTGTQPNSALTLNSMAIGGANATDFTIVSGGTCGVGISLPANGGSCTVNLQFRPGAIGARTASLLLTHNRALPSNGTSTSVTLNGTGGSGSVLALNNNATFSFTGVIRNTNQTKTVKVQNNGNAAAALNLSRFSIAGADASQFAITGTDCGNLAAGRTCNVNVRFTAPNAVRTFNATLSVTAPNAIPLVRTINLTATTR